MLLLGYMLVDCQYGLLRLCTILCRSRTDIVKRVEERKNWRDQKKERGSEGGRGRGREGR